MTPVSASSEPSFLFPSAYRRRLNAELTQIEGWIALSKMDDPLSLGIREWVLRLKEALLMCRKNSTSASFEANEREVHLSFIRLLDTLLRDPLSGAPLDDQAYYCPGDKNTYHSLSLFLYLSKGEAPSSFEVIPHPLVRHMAAWLSGYRTEQDPRTETLERDFLELKKAGRVPKLPTPQNARMREVFAQAKAAREEVRKKVDAASGAFKERMASEAEGFRKSVAEGMKEVNAKEEEVKKKAEEAFEKIRAEDERIKAEFEARCQVVQGNIEKAEKDLGEVDSLLREVDSALEQAFRDNESLGHKIEEAKRVIEEQNRRAQEGSFFSAALGIVFCAAATYFLGPSFKAVPLPGGGAGGFTIPF